MARATRWRQADERGLVIVWLAITLVVLLGVAAFAIDVSYWQLTKNREQRAADAAALAGAVSFPGNATAANAAAADIAASNGYDMGSTVTPVASGGTCSLADGSNLQVCGGPGEQNYQYKVSVIHRVQNFFGGIFGIGTTPVRASATAEYLKPLSMGSPSNQYGNDPDSITTFPATGSNGSPPNNYPNFWGNIAGGDSTKQKGDAYAADYCVGSTDGCSTTGFGKNLDFKPDGYFYTVDFDSTATVNLQAFDPGFVQVGDNCTDASLNGASALTSVPDYPQGNNPGEAANWAKRYRAVTDASNQADPGYQYCTGDNIFTDNGTTPPPSTTFTVLKSTVPGSPGSAVPVPGCDPITYPGYSGNVASLLGTGGSVAPGAPPLATYFRQWANLCQITGQAGDEYFIQITTDAASQGHNRFSLRAVTTGGDAAPVQVAANTYMGMYANVGSAPTQFYLARVPSAAAGHTLVLNFFDIGDAAAGSVGTLKILPPSDSNVGSQFDGCTWTGTSSTGATGFANNTPLAPWGPGNDIDQCEIGGVNDVPANWNGQWSTVTIPIPHGYKCSDELADGCWVKINYEFTKGIADTTSWNAFLLGDPVRLTR